MPIRLCSLVFQFDGQKMKQKIILTVIRSQILSLEKPSWRDRSQMTLVDVSLMGRSTLITFGRQRKSQVGASADFCVFSSSFHSVSQVKNNGPTLKFLITSNSQSYRTQLLHDL